MFVQGVMNYFFFLFPRAKFSVPNGLTVCALSFLECQAKICIRMFSCLCVCDEKKKKERKKGTPSTAHFCPTLWIFHPRCTVTEPSALIPVLAVIRLSGKALHCKAQ